MSTDDSAPVQPAKKKRVSSIINIALAVLLLLVCAVYYFMSKQALPSLKLSDEKITMLDVRFENIEKTTALYDGRIKKLEREVESLQATAQAATQANAIASAPGNSGPDDIQSLPDATAPTPPAPAALTGEDAKRIESLEKELAAIKAAAPLQDSAHVARSIKVLSAFHRLSDKVLSGKPFVEAQSAFEDVSGISEQQSKALAELAPYAENGVPMLAELLTSFDNAVDQLHSVLSVPPADAGVWDRFVFNITHLVRVRRIDEVQTGKDVDSIVGRAAGHLDKGEVEAAFAEINALPENVRANFTSWLEEAQASMDASGEIDQLEEQVMQLVFQPSAGKAEEGAEPVTIIDKGLNLQ